MGLLIACAAVMAAVLFNFLLGSTFVTAFGDAAASVMELLFAVIALGAGLLTLTVRKAALDRQHIEYDPDEFTVSAAFGFKLPSPRHLAGGLWLVVGGYQISILYYNIVMRLFPDVYAALNDSIMQSSYQGTFSAVFCSIAVIPAICEELLMRGAVQYGCRDLKKPIPIIVVTGVLFGLFHIDPMRIPFATVMGILLSYGYYRSGSILVPMAMHFANNAYSVIMSWQLRDMDTATIMAENAAALSDPTVLTVSTILSAVTSAVFAVFALSMGAIQLEPNLPDAIGRHRRLILGSISSIGLLAVGMIVCVVVFGY